MDTDLRIVIVFFFLFIPPFWYIFRGARLCLRSGFKFYLLGAAIRALAFLLPLAILLLLASSAYDSFWPMILSGMLYLTGRGVADAFETRRLTTLHRLRPAAWAQWATLVWRTKRVERLLLSYPQIANYYDVFPEDRPG